MENAKDYYCAECGRTDERVALVNNCPVFTKHCPMRNKVEQVDEAVPDDPTSHLCHCGAQGASKRLMLANCKALKCSDPSGVISPAESDPTNPDHYKQGDIECIDAIKAATIELTGEEAYCTGCAIKYLWRWKLKGGTEDLRKARWYLNRLIGD